MIYRIGLHCYQILNKIIFPIYLVRHKTEWKVEESSKFDDRFDCFWSKISEEYDYIAVRNKEFLQWRYGDQRGGEYSVKIVVIDSELLGFSVLRIDQHKNNYSVGYIVELLALPNHTSVVDSLFNEAMTYFMNQGVEEVQYWVPKRHPYRRSAKKFGFIHLPKDPFINFFFYNHHPKMEDLLRKSDKVYFSFGDCDII
jgi:hypothetical protein